MKKVLVIQLFLVSALLGAQNFDSVVDFDTRLSDLSDQASVERVVADSRVLILEGILGDRVRDAGGGDSWIDLLGGEWIGTEDVIAYTCHIRVDGDRWPDSFPSQRPDEPDGNFVPPGSRLLAVVDITGWNAVTEGPEAVLLGYRVLN